MYALRERENARMGNREREIEKTWEIIKERESMSMITKRCKEEREENDRIQRNT